MSSVTPGTASPTVVHRLGMWRGKRLPLAVLGWQEQEQMWARTKHQCSLRTPGVSHTQLSPKEASRLQEQLCTGQFNFLFPVRATYFLKSPGTWELPLPHSSCASPSMATSKSPLNPTELWQQLCSCSSQSVTKAESTAGGRRLLGFLIRYLASSRSS